MRDLRQAEVEQLLKRIQDLKLKKLKVAIYARKSREDEMGTSLSTQIEECNTFIERYNFLFETNESFTFQEDNVSGFFIEHREQYSKMMKLVENGEIQVVLTMKIDRFSRDSVNIPKYIEEITSKGAYFIAGDDLGDDTAAGILIKQIMWATNEFVGRRSVEDSMKVRLKLSRDGYAVGGVGNYGYDIINRKYMINPEEAIVVNIAFDRIIQGSSYKEIIDELDIKGYKSRSGKKFSLSTINSILTNERNYGLNIWNSEKKRKDKKRVLKEAFGEVSSLEAVPEPIIIKEKFDKVQSIIQTRIVPRTGIKHKPYLLTGLVRCAKCGGLMTGFSQKAGHSGTRMRYYICPRHTDKRGSKCETKGINATHLENTVKSMINEMIDKHVSNTGVSNTVIQQFLKEDNRIRTRLKRELSKYEEKVEKLLLGLDDITSDTVKKTVIHRIEQTGKLIDHTNSSVNELELRLSMYQANTIQSQLNSTNLLASDGLVRELITNVIDAIVVNNTEVSIQLKD